MNRILELIEKYFYFDTAIILDVIIIIGKGFLVFMGAIFFIVLIISIIKIIFEERLNGILDKKINKNI
ncbi:hypothetical protein SH1V18_48270 [Vallitalea longa]|uniref:Uncharacterized protein n=1 Tax=Vallitalea longa TaxID=2936439 RepID=A0A9W5YE85_9FIRM|nr:hypothetical protein [Vallitalea longa]GKX32347.1 hypothetical protein SH1V18_48270 [Vallitalea longa]